MNLLGSDEPRRNVSRASAAGNHDPLPHKFRQHCLEEAGADRANGLGPFGGIGDRPAGGVFPQMLFRAGKPVGNSLFCRKRSASVRGLAESRLIIHATTSPSMLRMRSRTCRDTAPNRTTARLWASV